MAKPSTSRAKGQTAGGALPRERLLDLYRQMVLVRRFEEKAAEMYTRGKIGGFLHLYIGQEATGVGAIAALRPEDYVVSHYREHGHCLAKGSDPKRVMAELFGKATGLCRGKGGSMHLFDAETGFLGGYAIVAGGMPIAVGLALASAYREDGRVVLNFFGDGAANEGEFHESLNLAALWKLPVVFLLENNLYAMGTALERACAEPELYRRAVAYAMPGLRVDGMDVLAVLEATKEAVDRARSGGGPTLLEAITYRYRGHSMADPAQYRTKEEEAEWRHRDPLEQFAGRLLADDGFTQAELDGVQGEVEAELEEAVRFAEESPELPLSALYEDTYAE